MTLAATATTLDADAIGRISDHLGEPGWMRDLRAAWWERASATPPPTGQEEEWRRTDLAPLPRDGELLIDPPTLEVSLPHGAAEAGVIVTDLRTAVRDHGDLVRRHLGQADGLASHAHFWALAQAAWTGGVFCHVPRGVAVDGTVVVRTALGRPDVTYLPVTLVVAEEGADVTLLEEVSSPDGAAGWYGGIAEVVTEQGAQVRYAKLQQLGDGAWNIGSQRVVVGQDANVTTLNAEVGSKVTKVGLDVADDGQGRHLAAAGPARRRRRPAHRHQLRAGPPRQLHHKRPALPVGAVRRCPGRVLRGDQGPRRLPSRRAPTRSAATCSSARPPGRSPFRSSRSRRTTSCAAATAPRPGRSIRSSCSTRRLAASTRIRRSG